MNLLWQLERQGAELNIVCLCLQNHMIIALHFKLYIKVSLEKMD